jgi:NADH dehydrogenase
VTVDVALASLSDQRGVRAALIGVDTLVLLDEDFGNRREDELGEVVEGTRAIAEGAAEAGLRRIIYISQLGADKSSAYPVMRAKAEAEEYLHRSGTPLTILRPAALYGRGDHFSVPLAMMLSISPLFFPIPGDGTVLIQPLWVEDLATCITWVLDEPSTIGEVFDIGGPEYLSLRQVLQLIMQRASSPRIIFSLRLPYVRAASRFLNGLLPRSPVNSYMLDYLSVNRTTDLDTLPHLFGLQPSRMEDKLAYLEGRNWGWELIARQFSARNGGR